MVQVCSGGGLQFYNEVLKGSTLENNVVSDWLYGEWNEEKLRTFEKLYAIRPVKIYFDYLLDRRADREYLDRYGLDYTSVHDPRKLRQVGSASTMYGYGMNFVSDNVRKLYR